MNFAVSLTLDYAIVAPTKHFWGFFGIKLGHFMVNAFFFIFYKQSSSITTKLEKKKRFGKIDS